MRHSLRAMAVAGCCSAAFASTGCGGSSSPGSPSAFLPAQNSAQSIESRAKSQTLLYVAGEDAVYVYTESGHQTQVFAKSTGANDIAMDDAGHVYVGYTKNSLAYAARYAIGGSKPLATYTPSTSGDSLGYVIASHQGEVIWLRFHETSGGTSFVYDVWDPGKSGPASRSFTYLNGSFTYALDNKGALYVPYYDPTSQTYRYDEIPAGASKPSRTIVEKIVTGPNAQAFSPYTMTALTDGTLYVGEWTFVLGDPSVGLYVYPPQGQERLVTNGASPPVGTAVDASGDVHVLESNYAYNPANGKFTCDTIHTISTYSPGAMSLLSQATSGFRNGEALTVAANGTAFIDEFPYGQSSKCTAQTGIASVAPHANSGTQIVNIVNQDVVLYDGTRATNPYSQALP